MSGHAQDLPNVPTCCLRLENPIDSTLNQTLRKYEENTETVDFFFKVFENEYV